MINAADAAKRLLKTDGKSVFIFGDGEDARFFVSNGPWKSAAKEDRPAVVILPPFAEEMNRCRRLVSLTQSALDAHGLRSLSVDYYGTGDSAGEFVDARLAHWEQDVIDTCMIANKAGASSIQLLGFRFGALMAARVAPRIPSVSDIIAVGPQDSFKRAIRQFIRIASTTQQVSESTATGLRTPGTTKRLESGETIEIGGYQLSAALYQDFVSIGTLKQSQANLTMLFVGSGTTPGQKPSASEIRQLSSFASTAKSLRYSHVNDTQMWYQGIPDEPVTLPGALAKALQGDWPLANYKT